MLLFLAAVCLTPLSNPQRDQIINGKLAAVVVDMQPVYLCGITDKEKKREIPKLLKTLDFCHENEIPIFVLEIDGGGETLDVIKEKLNDYGATYITKEGTSGFDGTDFELQLKKAQARSLILMGINASVCVKNTAEDALDLGFGICTSKQIIAEPPVWHRGYKTYESISWFTRNGVYCDNYRDLLYVISKGIEENKRFDGTQIGPVATKAVHQPSRDA
jgi:nicotinamidase-related amidase